MSRRDFDHSPEQNNQSRLGYTTSPSWHRRPQPMTQEDSLIFSSGSLFRSSATPPVQFSDIDDSLMTSIDETPIAPPPPSQPRRQIVPFGSDGSPVSSRTSIMYTPPVRPSVTVQRQPSPSPAVHASPWAMSVFNRATSVEHESISDGPGIEPLVLDGLMESHRRSPYQGTPQTSTPSDLMGILPLRGRGLSDLATTLLLTGAGVGYSLSRPENRQSTISQLQDGPIHPHIPLANVSENPEPSGMMGRIADGLLERRRAARQLVENIKKAQRKRNPDTWRVIRHIISYELWYEKISNDEMINTWLSNLRNEGFDDDVIWTSLKILQASVQGLKIEERCSWIQNVVCPSCRVTMTEEGWEEYCEQIGEDHESRESEEFRAWLADFLDEESGRCEHSRCLCVQPNAKVGDYVVHRSVLSDELQISLLGYISRMRSFYHKTPILLDPSSFPYVQGVSALRDGTIQHEVDEKDRYAWLPSEFDVDDHGRVKLESYINGLHPQHQGIIPFLEQALSSTLPLFEDVLHRKLRNHRIQVVVEITSVKAYNRAESRLVPWSSWQFVGLPRERIVAAGVHHLSHQNIDNCLFRFRKFVSLDDTTFPHRGTNFSPFHFGADPEDIYQGHNNRLLGSVQCFEGATIVFPNTLQYQILMSSPDKGRHIALMFYLVDPDRPVISTEHILHQTTSDEYGDKSSVTFTPEEMSGHRDALRYHRKHYNKDITQYVFGRKFDFSGMDSVD